MLESLLWIVSTDFDLNLEKLEQIFGPELFPITLIHNEMKGQRRTTNVENLRRIRCKLPRPIDGFEFEINLSYLIQVE